MPMFSKYDINGYLEIQDDTTHVVSMWHIPGGTEYHKASIIYLFYSDEKAADAFCAKWDAPPEMPSKMTVAQYREICRQLDAHEKRQKEDRELDYLYDEPNPNNSDGLSDAALMERSRQEVMNDPSLW